MAESGFEIRRERVSEVLAVVGTILLMLDTMNTFLLPRMGLDLLTFLIYREGVSSVFPVILLFTSFGIVFGLKAKLRYFLLEVYSWSYQR